MCQDQNQIEEMLRSMDFDDAPNESHRSELKDQLLRDWPSRVHPKTKPHPFMRAIIRKGQLVMKHKITSFAIAAAAVIAIIVGLNYFAVSPDAARTAWAIEDTINAVKAITKVHISGLLVTGRPFNLWAQNKPEHKGLASLRAEGEGNTFVVIDNVIYFRWKGSNRFQICNTASAKTLGLMLKISELKEWTGGTIFEKLRDEAEDWQESYGVDEQTGLQCAFVTCNYPPLNCSYEFVFSMATMLPIRARQWYNLDRKGTPIYHVTDIVYDEDVPDDVFVFDMPEDAPVLDQDSVQKLAKMGKNAEALFNAKKYADALIIYEQAYEIYPEPGVLMMMGCCHLYLNQLDKSVEILEKCVREYSESGRVADEPYFCLARAYHAIGRKQEALNAYKKCIELCKLRKGYRQPDKYPWKDAQESIDKLEAELQPQD
ncbi:MAG: tetratricopeptide repeat protein [Planctomycetota bacterium]|jgi:hypothetical protein